VVHEDIDATIVRDHPLDHARHRLALADVGFDRADPCALSAQLRGCRLEVLRLAACDRDGGAGPRETRGDAEADPRAATRDERDASSEHVRPKDRCLGGSGPAGRIHAPSARAAILAVNAASRRRNSGPWSAWTCAAPSMARTCSSAPTSCARTRRLIAR